jgi:predicted component of type VI protein secretion system
VRRDQFRRMLPGGGSLARLVAIVRNYVGDGLHWDLRLTLLKEAVKPTKLGVEGQLGRTSWLLGDPRLMTWDDFVFDPQDENRNDAPANVAMKPATGAGGGSAHV